ncbi:hypothetical protein [Arthrobacter sp. zg-Y877]|uniref:hypothetical protein n=1 Tax=Arthrobacter sp. zg-Y877 TaxID=3049074 RepID=UPI0025A31E71|nr:hypothetical protein [Arthrobacter sp. zg-Y877]MDM7991344.1 hypothetical protein [Arthrobacter sp. zg-Y877]
MSANILEFLLAASITVFIGAIAWWARTHPNRSREYPERVRMPKVVPIFGWVAAGFGVLIGSWAWFSSDGPLGARVASVAMLLGGLAFVAMYRNFYVARVNMRSPSAAASARNTFFPTATLLTTT